MFLSKVKSDLSRSIDVDATSFITRCVNHVRGLKSETVMDSHFDTMTVTGVGHRLRCECAFFKVSQSLFRRFVQELDSQINDQSGDSEYSSGSGCTNDESELPDIDEHFVFKFLSTLDVSKSTGLDGNRSKVIEACIWCYFQKYYIYC